MSRNWKRLLQEEMKQDADRIMEEVNSDPTLEDVKAPEEIHEKLMQQIRELEGEKETSKLTAEERELIQLGKVYKKRRKWSRYAILAAAIVGALAVSVTSLGGPQRAIEAVKRMLGKREQTQIDVRGESTAQSGIANEEKAYQQIEEVFDAITVRPYYLPDGMEFTEYNIEEEIQNARVYYEKGKEKILSCTMWFNYRVTSTGMDTEDAVISEQNIDVGEYAVHVKQYAIEGSDSSRWKAEFQHQKVQYFIAMEGFSEEEMQKTLKNLYFFEK